MPYPYDASHQLTPGPLSVPATHSGAVKPLDVTADAALETQPSYAAGDQERPTSVAPPPPSSDNFYG